MDEISSSEYAIDDKVSRLRWMPGFQVGPQQRQSILRQGDVPVLGTLASVHMDYHTLAANVGNLKGEGFVEAQ